MPNYFKSHSDILTDTSNTTLLTCTATSSYIVGSIVLTNKHASSASTIDITIVDNSESNTIYVVKAYSMASGQSQELLERPLILEGNDILKAQAAAGNVFDIYISYMDRSRV